MGFTVSLIAGEQGGGAKISSCLDFRRQRRLGLAVAIGDSGGCSGKY